MLDQNNAPTTPKTSEVAKRPIPISIMYYVLYVNVVIIIKIAELIMLNKKMRTFFCVICFCLSHLCIVFAENSPVQAVKKVYLKKEKDDYFLCIDFNKDTSLTPRTHTLSNGIKIFLSFKENVALPKSKSLTHSLIRGCFFEKFSPESLIFVVAFKKSVIFTKKEFSPHSLKIGFRINKKHLIAIDAGHGGQDSGATGTTGDMEKNITLISAIELRNQLIKSGRYNVTLIRDSDIFIPLQERISKINSLSADILISLHTNCSDSGKNTRGISIYTLPNLNLSRKTSENNSNMKDRHYCGISSRLQEFAQSFIGYIPQNCRKNKPRKISELKILECDVPSVLIELGCIPDKIDNELLHSKSIREKVYYAILYALDKFFKKGKQ